ncbi:MULTISPECIES: Flp family type IVb pilin [unclassified Brenneria]|uniref:Flp family type IVb pilin n=1 Tax=unclassified Brenneria TaxID=2634434 RepID=UPI00155205DF|nr:MULTISPECIES: Flp family type IVb pilin [unclassified Brenneria]MBJ7222709.1 Flp family type IVb pilin [Brenneria sp. L3-3C-1]MEE3643952.1 Flp family type IVb pilin [Brenneria sp. L3_3C_1]MEE3651095.1 Flp family type IVb pilin [Brenneria sp. HEZEL_4_2_4]NPD01050.1 Flp family type IVb pilin [Brenneria sp. hezel4-2-4]
MRNFLKKLQKDERGVSALEYAILAGVIVVIVAGGITTFGDKVDTLFKNANTSIEKAVTESEAKK